MTEKNQSNYPRLLPHPPCLCKREIYLKYDKNTGKFYRCPTDLVGESYLDTEGNPHDYWKEVK